MLSLPIDSAVRKTYPLFNGLFGYFGAALAAVAHHSWKSNEKHNPGEPLHWSMDKSNDHADCIARHLLDLHEMLASEHSPEEILDEANALAWRALALCQTLHMELRGAMLPFNATETDGEPALRGWTAEEAARPTVTDAWTSGCDVSKGPCRCGAWH